MCEKETIKILDESNIQAYNSIYENFRGLKCNGLKRNNLKCNGLKCND